MSTALFLRARFSLAQGGEAQKAGITRPHYKIGNTGRPLLKELMLKVKLTEKIIEWRCVCVCLFTVGVSSRGNQGDPTLRTVLVLAAGNVTSCNPNVGVDAQTEICLRQTMSRFDGWKNPTRGGKYELVRVRVWMLKAWRGELMRA